MRGLISYCFWGEDKKYINGLQRNIETIRKKLLGYEIMLAIEEGSNFNADVDMIYVASKEYKKHKLMFCRFFPASWEWIDVFYSKDLDSPVLDREIAAMKEFEKSDKMFHIMRDHPLHTARIVGGMWGAKYGAVPNMCRLILENKHMYKNEWYCDQHFLEDIIYPLIQEDALIHDSIGIYEDEKDIRKDFPSERKGDEFVGQVIEADGSRHEEHHKVLTEYLNNK